MADVDAILASGRYTDRKGRTWRSLWNRDYLMVRWLEATTGRALNPDQMRLKIVRERHRDECPGLRRCQEHPVPHVVYWRLSRRFEVYDLPGDRVETAYTLAEALDAARRMTGEQK